MSNILDINQALSLSRKLKGQGKTLVLAGGCFDILHVGHITFLENSKAQGDILILLLEPDERIRKIKGPNRPINTQKIRAKILSALNSVDIVINLPDDFSDGSYDDLIEEIKPDEITVTKNDPSLPHKKRQAEKTGAKLVEVTDYLDNQSTSTLVKLLGGDL